VVWLVAKEVAMQENDQGAGSGESLCAIGAIGGHRSRGRQMHRCRGFAGNLKLEAGAGHRVQFKRLIH
jgi:hypothetical protein